MIKVEQIYGDNIIIDLLTKTIVYFNFMDTDISFFGGSLDYFFIKKWFFDLKDIYLYASLFYMIIYLIKPENFPGKVNIKCFINNILKEIE
jgi:hypothetical protein